MTGNCPGVPTGGAFLSEMLGHLDCQAQTIGAAGYQALASPGSATSILVTSLLTIFIALLGFRMLVGQTPDVRDGVVAALKIGLVLAFASSWGAYRTLAYDVVLRAPSELASTIGQASALPGTDGSMTQRLQNADDLILYFASVGSGQPLLTGQAELSPVERARLASPLVSDSFAFGIARTSYLVSTIGPLAVVRLGAGILLALAPLFAGFLLFDATRGLFFGWLRALGAVAIGALAITLTLSVELAVIEPWLSDALTRRAATFATPAAPNELLAMTLIFGLATFSILTLFGRLAFTLHLSAPWAGGAARQPDQVRRSFVGAEVPSRDEPRLFEQSRAARIADAVARGDRRENQMTSAATINSTSTSRSPTQASRTEIPGMTQAPIGRQFRRSRTRVSAGARLRDR